MPALQLPCREPVSDPLLGAFLGDLRSGLILTDRNGRIGGCTTEGRRLLGLPPSSQLEGRGLAHVLRRVRLDPGESRAVIRAQLRQPLRDRQPVSLDVAIEGRNVTLDLRPLTDAGWTIRVKDTLESSGTPLPDGWRDSLTGLANRPHFAIRLKEAQARLSRTGESFALLAVDLDRFKQVNDTLGHPIGDELSVQGGGTPADHPAGRATPWPGSGAMSSRSCKATSADQAGAETLVLAARIVDLLGRSYMLWMVT